MATVKVFAVPGVVVGRPDRRGSFLGYRVAQHGETPDHEVNGGLSYVRLESGETVREDAFIRAAIRKGSLSRSAPTDAGEEG